MRKTLAFVVVAIAILTLAGCTSYTKTDALATPGSVIELTDATWNTASTFGYVNNNRDVVKLTQCEDPFFGQSHCMDADKLYNFKWSLDDDGNINSASVTRGGETYSLDCNADPESEDVWHKLFVCLPHE